MSSSGIIITAILIGISIYDFNILKKSKLKITKCVSSALITLVFNLVLLGIGALIGSVIFGSNNDYWIIISLILISGISYFRFKGREISKDKIKFLDCTPGVLVVVEIIYYTIKLLWRLYQIQKKQI